MTKETFSQWLLTEMNKRSWSQGELARRAGVTQGAVSHVLGDMRSPGPEFCKAVAFALDYPQEFVFRKAGILDDTPTKEDALTCLLNHYFAQLTPQEQQIILDQIEALARKRERATAPKRSRSRK